MIELLVNGHPLDLNQNERLTLQIESNIMKNMKDYKASYSYSYNIPLTDSNIRTLSLNDIIHQGNVTNRQPVCYNDVEYVDGGVNIFHGQMYIESIDLNENVAVANLVMSKNEAIEYWKKYDIKPSQIMNRVDVWEDNFREKGEKFAYTSSAMKGRYFADYTNIQSLNVTDATCPYYKLYGVVPDAGDCYGRIPARADGRAPFVASPWLMNETTNILGAARAVTGTVNQEFCNWSLSLFAIGDMIQRRDNVKFEFTDFQKRLMADSYYLTARLAKRDYAHVLVNFNQFTNPAKGSIGRDVGLFPLTTCSLPNEKLWTSAYNHWAYNLHSETGENLPSYYTAKNQGGYVYRQPIAFYQNAINLMSIHIKSNTPYRSWDGAKNMCIYLANDFHETADGGGNWNTDSSTADVNSDIMYKVYTFPIGFNGNIDVTINLKDTDLPESFYRSIHFLPQVRIWPCERPDSNVPVEGLVDYEFYFDGEDERLAIPQMYYMRADVLKKWIPTDGGKAGSIGWAYHNWFDSLPNNINITEWLSNIMFDTCGAFAVTKNMEQTNTIYWLGLDDIYARPMVDWTDRMIEGDETAYNSLSETGTELDRFKHSYFVHNNDWLSTIINVYNSQLVTKVDCADDILDFSGNTYESTFEYHWPHLLYAKKSAGQFNQLNDRIITWNRDEVHYGRSGAQIKYLRGEPLNMPYHSKDGCYFLNHLEEFPVFLNTIKKPVVVKGRFIFKPHHLKELDMTRPVYLDQFGCRFAVINLQTSKLNDDYEVVATLLQLAKE